MSHRVDAPVATKFAQIVAATKFAQNAAATKLQAPGRRGCGTPGTQIVRNVLDVIGMIARPARFAKNWRLAMIAPPAMTDLSKSNRRDPDHVAAAVTNVPVVMTTRRNLIVPR